MRNKDLKKEMTSNYIVRIDEWFMTTWFIVLYMVRPIILAIAFCDWYWEKLSYFWWQWRTFIRNNKSNLLCYAHYSSRSVWSGLYIFNQHNTERGIITLILPMRKLRPRVVELDVHDHIIAERQTGAYNQVCPPQSQNC